MIYIGNIEILTAKSAIYLGNVGHKAVLQGDVEAFRDQVHALRGTSGNVGADALWRLCRSVSGMTNERLRQEGSAFSDRLTHELTQFRHEHARGATARQLNSPSLGSPS